MDARHFDNLAKHLSSRRAAIGGLLAGLLIPLEAAARGKGKHRQRKSKGKDRNKGKANKRRHANAQAEPCWRAGACTPKKGANVSQCDLAGYSPTSTLDCTGCNASRANLRGAKLQGANFTRANLSGSCLVGADFTGATFANNTNLASAIFCNTTMPNGFIENSGCGSGTACCPTCTRGVGMTCGAPGETCCNSICQDGVCQPCDVCASGCPFTSVQAAVDSTTPQLSTIRVCPGTYLEIAPGFFNGLTIGRSLTLIGAGDGADPTTSTIINPAPPKGIAVWVTGANPVRLEGMRFTGGNGANASGMAIDSSIVTIANCTSVDNHTGSINGEGTGASLHNSHVTLFNTRVERNTSPIIGGIRVDNSTLILDELSRVTDNEANGLGVKTGGILADASSVTLPNVNNVTGNRPNNCRSDGGTFTGPGAICTTT